MVGDYKGKECLLHIIEQLHVCTLSGYEHARDLRADQTLTRIGELGTLTPQQSSICWQLIAFGRRRVSFLQACKPLVV